MDARYTGHHGDHDAAMMGAPQGRTLAVWTKAPWRGLWLLAMSAAAAFIYMELLTSVFGVADAELTLFYPTLFFLWAFSFLNAFERWPFQRLAQPWSGFAGAILGWVLIIPIWAWLKTLMDPYAANALLFYALFVVFLVSWFSDEWLSGVPLPQPLKGLTVLGWSLLIGWLVYTLIGVISSVWLYLIIMWGLYFLELWPVPAGTRKEARIAFSVVMIISLTWLLNYIHNLIGAPMSGSLGNDLESLLWAGMTPLFVTEAILVRGKQPWKGLRWILLSLGLGALFAGLYFYVFQAPEWWISRWIFVLWTWVVIFQWMPAPWPAQREEVNR